MLKRFLAYCLLLLPVCTVMADGVNHQGCIREVMAADGALTGVFHADYDAWGYLFSVGIPSLVSAAKNKGGYAKVVEIEPHKGVFIVKKHMTKWFEMSANKKARDYFKKRGKDWGNEAYPISISKILYYIQRR